MIGDRLLGAIVALFAGWTALCHAVVLLGGNLLQLEALAAAALVAGGIGWAWAARSRERTPEPTSLEPDPGTDGEPPAAPVALRWAVAGGALVCVAALAWTGSIALFWTGAVAVVAAASAGEWRLGSVGDGPPSPEAGAPDAAPASARVPMALLCVGCAASTLFLHRPDADDAYYLNFAVAATDHPEWPLIARDTLHGVAGVPLSLAVYKVHSLELLEAAIAHWTPLRVLDVAHVLLPALAAGLVPLAYARLFRLLAPRRWLLAVGFLVGILFCVGWPHQTYGNFAFVRLQQGKALLLTLALPVVIHAALAFGARSGRARWLWLAATQVAAIGLSATGLWLVPSVAAIALAAGVPATMRGMVRLAAGVGASGYVLGMAVWLAGQTRAAFAASDHDWSEKADAGFALGSVLGDGALAWIGLFVLLAGWSAAGTVTLRRLALAFSAAFLLVFWNPWLDGAIGAWVTGEPTYWRVFWLLPLPALAAAMCTWPWEAIRPRALAGAATGATALLLLWAAPAHPTWSTHNFVHIGLPGWKLPPLAGEAARQLVATTAEGSTVLAPTAVARWVPVQHHHPYPLVVRHLYLNSLRGHIPDAELEERERLTRIVSGEIRPPGAAAQLSAAIERLPLSAVCLSARAQGWPELQRALRESALEPVLRNREFEVWARPQGR